MDESSTTNIILNILLINGDGIDTIGIKALKNILWQRGHHTFIVAPALSQLDEITSLLYDNTVLSVGKNLYQYAQYADREQEYQVIRLEHSIDQQKIFAIKANTADCLLVAHHLFPTIKFDIILFGIHNTHYTGPAASFNDDIMSGPKLAVSTLSPFGILPTLAIHMENAVIQPESNNELKETKIIFEQHFDDCALFTVNFIAALIKNKCPFCPLLARGVFLNINYPALPRNLIKDIGFCDQGDSYLWRVENTNNQTIIQALQLRCVVKKKTSGQHVLKTVREFVEAHELFKNADSKALVEGYVAIVFCETNCTSSEYDEHNLSCQED